MSPVTIHLIYEEPLPTSSRHAFLMEDEIRRWVDRIEPESATDFKWLRENTWIVGASFSVSLADAPRRLSRGKALSSSGRGFNCLPPPECESGVEAEITEVASRSSPVAPGPCP